MPAKHLFPFQLFYHTDISIPSRSHSHNHVEQLMELITALCFVSHSTVVVTIIFLAQYTVVLQKTEASHTMGLC